jgi:3',5'-nucleoside bisphosphate phosphatase
MKSADLHLHTTASDGTNTPAEIVKRAKELGFKAIAITDHDTIDGLKEATEAGQSLGVEIIPGIELNTFGDGKEIHILGYYCDPLEECFISLLVNLRESRIKRINLMLDKLNSLEFAITLEEVQKDNPQTSNLGRPHIAQTLINKGYASSIREVFDKYIGVHGPAYVSEHKLTPQAAVREIIEAKGIPVIAHPFLVGDDTIIKELKPAGLKGIEVYHSDHDVRTSQHYLKLAREYNLLVTGGSDDHGKLKGTELLGKVRLPYYYVEELQHAKQS